MYQNGHAPPDNERGITGLETAIILIAFVVVASVFAFTVLSTGVFSAERAKDTIYAGLQETRSSLEPKSALIAYAGGAGSGVQTVYKVSFIVSPAVAGSEIDLTPPYSADDSGTDPDIITGAEYRTVISYVDSNQFIVDVPWSVEFIGESSGDTLLEAGEKAEITVWLLRRDYSVANVEDADAVLEYTGPDANGAHGILETGGVVLTPNDRFVLEVKPTTGAVMTLQRRLPAALAKIMDLR